MALISPWHELPAIAALGWCDRQSVGSYQDRKLLQLVRHVYSSNSFYRRLWDQAGFDPSRFKGREDLYRLPLVTKQQVRSLTALLREKPPAGCGRLIWHNTSGSSGEPFSLVRSWREERFLALIRMMAMHGIGFRPWHRRARVRVPADFDWLDDRPLRVLNKAGLYRGHIFSCYLPMDVLWKQISDYAPDALNGYSETVARVARYGLEAQLRDIRPKLVFVGGELCTPMMSRQMAEAFQAPVYQAYAATECNLIALSCERSRLLHICDPTVLVEVLDDGGKPVAEGESGTAVVTVLHSRVMPFVRYVLGDRVVRGPAPCSCGAPYGTLQSIDGREIDRLRLSNGETVHAYVLLNILLLSDTSWIRQYQLLQDEPGFIDVHIWPMRTPEPEVLEYLRSKLQEMTAGTVIRMKLVDGMELDSGGKFRLCRCSLD